MPGWIVGVMGGLGLLRCVYSYGSERYLVVGLSLALWALGPMLGWRRRPQVAQATVSAQGLRVGDVLVPPGAAAQLAKGRRGASVALGWGAGDGAMFEVASMSDARALLAKAHAVEGRPVALKLRYDKLRWLTSLVGGLGVMCGIGYAVTVGVMHQTDLKGTFGLPGLCLAVAASFLFLIAQLARQTVVVGAPGSGDATTGIVARHLELHSRHQLMNQAELAADATSGLDAAPPRVRVMVRENEPTHAWLARIDGTGAAGEGYRGLAPSREELSSVLADGTARADLRLAAARVLVRQHGEKPETVVLAMDAQLRGYARLALDEDAEQAAERMDALGPLFMQ